jgi:hypothetical protein
LDCLIKDQTTKRQNAARRHRHILEAPEPYIASTFAASAIEIPRDCDQ